MSRREVRPPRSKNFIIIALDISLHIWYSIIGNKERERKLCLTKGKSIFWW